jgi:hypothetical protein
VAYPSTSGLKASENSHWEPSEASRLFLTWRLNTALLLPDAHVESAFHVAEASYRSLLTTAHTACHSGITGH